MFLARALNHIKTYAKFHARDRISTLFQEK